MNLGTAFLLTAAAGLSTGIGSAIALFAKKTNKKFLAASLGFSAGVMIYVSMAELFVRSRDFLVASFGNKFGLLYAILAFFGGIFLIAAIDKLIPEKSNPHEMPCTDGKECDTEHRRNKQLLRSGLLTALAIAVHNFPEGLATFVSALQSPGIAIPIVVAIAIHNIPEGISVAVPIMFATGNRFKAFWLSLLSGLAELLGAAIGYLILLPFLNDTLFGILYGIVAGIMVYISIDELLPSAEAYGYHHAGIYGLIAGMAVMAVSLWLFV
jgi:ZIP family zinc transporter